MFNEEEKKKILQEFTFNDCDRLNRNETNMTRNSRDFSEYNFESTDNELLRNHSTKSVILAPFNSSATSMDIQLSDTFKEMVRSKKAIQFKGKTREINRKYEENNNGEMDNGVYNESDSDGSDHFRSKRDDDLDLNDDQIDKEIQDSELRRARGEQLDVERLQEEVEFISDMFEDKISPKTISKLLFSSKPHRS